MVHIYCGDGKGKTTAAMGLALRCAGSGRRALVLQFLKDGSSSELAPLSRTEGAEVVPQTRAFGFTWTLSPEEREEAGIYYSGLLEAAWEKAASGGYGLLVLDEALGSSTRAGCWHCWTAPRRGWRWSSPAGDPPRRCWTGPTMSPRCGRSSTPLTGAWPPGGAWSTEAGGPAQAPAPGAGWKKLSNITLV